MRTLMWSLVVALASTWALSSLANAGEAEKCKAKVWLSKSGEGNKVFVAESEEDDNVFVTKSGEVQVVVLSGGESRGTSEETEDGNAIVICGTGDRQPINLAVTREREADPDSGWLGVQIGGFVPEDDESGDTRGVVILNVIEDSPAEEAGLQRNDVIIEINDEAVGDDVGVLVNRIRDAGKGSRVKFTVLRDGEHRTMVATLGSRADSKPLTWVFESFPDAIWKDKLRTKARVLLRGDDDQWVLEDLSKLDGLSGFSGHILTMLPKSQGKTVEVTVTDGGTAISTTVTRDGRSITVQRTGDGEIVVTRSAEDGDEESVARYSDEDELAASDEEAYEVYKDSSNQVVVELKSGHFLPQFKFDFDLDMDEIDDHISNVLERFDIQLKDWTIDSEDLKEHIGNLHIDLPRRALRMHTKEARRSIHENADGTIEVIIRKGYNELVTHYSSATDLKARDPETYESYLDLLEVDENE